LQDTDQDNSVLIVDRTRPSFKFPKCMYL